MKPLILITNDDGVYSPGLWAVAEAVQDLGDLLIVAPMFQQTGMGRALPKEGNVGIIKKVKIMVNGNEVDAFGVHGSPALAVSHAVLELTDRKPDLCISGINYGENLGLSLTCSGTLGAAFEADSHGIPSIAVSREVDLSKQHSSEYQSLDWEAAKNVTKKIANEVLKRGFPEGVRIFNINVPDSATCKTEVRVTSQSRNNYSIFVRPEKRDLGKSYILHSQLDVDIEKTEKCSDIYAFLFDKVISITPLTWDLSIKINGSFDGLDFK